MLKLEESKLKKLEELKKVTEPSPEQNAEIATLELEGKKGRYEELFLKPENQLTDEEVNEFLTLSDEMKTPKEDKPKPAGEKQPEDEGEEPEDEGKADKKFAGIYNSIEDLAKGILSSETERVRIENEHPELIPELEKFYKDSQRKVTKLVQKDKEVKAAPKPLKDRRLFEMSPEEYETWEKTNKMEAHAWLSQATALNASQRASAQKVFEKHPEFFAMAQGVIPPSEAWLAYDRVAQEHPEWERVPNGPEMCLEEMEKALNPGGKKAAPAAAPKPKKIEPKPDLGQGKASGGSPAKGSKMTVAEFEKLSAEEQRRVMEESVSFS